MSTPANAVESLFVFASEVLSPYPATLASLLINTAGKSVGGLGRGTLAQ